MIEELIKNQCQDCGGIAVICGFLISTIYLIIVMSIEGSINLNAENYFVKVIGYIIGIVILSIFCFIDDVKNIPAIIKLLAQIVAAVVVVATGTKINTFDIPFLNNNIELSEAFSYVLTVGWIIGITNAINLIDGLDGLSSGITLISCLSLLIIFALNKSPLISIILITALAGAIVGFLPYNFNPAKTFIGDTGSNFLGFSLAFISILRSS